MAARSPKPQAPSGVEQGRLQALMRGDSPPDGTADAKTAGKNEHIHGQDPGPDPGRDRNLDGHIKDGDYDQPGGPTENHGGHQKRHVRHQGRDGDHGGAD